MTFAGIYFIYLYNLGLPVWAWAILFFAPDIGMTGYLVNNKIGAVSYNLFHHKGVALAVGFIGYFLLNDVLVAVGALLFAHSSFDRMLGYGLKHETGFGDTHLGRVGRK